MTVYVYNDPDKALLQDDEGLSGLIASIASLTTIIFGRQTISSLIAESKKRTPILFVLSQIHKLRNKLNWPRQHLDDSIESLELCTNDIYFYHCKHREPIRPALVPNQVDTIPSILASLEQMRRDLGPINWLQVTSTEFAIIIGVCVGEKKFYPWPQLALRHMAEIGTGVVREMYTLPPPIPVPDMSWTYPRQPAQPHATQPTPDPEPDSDVEDDSPCDVQSDSQDEPDDDSSPRCGRATVVPACSTVDGFLPPTSTVLASKSYILQQVQRCQVAEDISNQISELQISEGDLEALDHGVPDAEM